MTGEQNNHFSREERLNEMIAEYFEIVEAGHSLNVKTFIERCPDFAAELEEFFADNERVDRVVKPFMNKGEGPETADPFIGQVIGGFRIVRRIGQGGMGLVFEAQEIALRNRRVALKILPFEFTAEPKAIARFKREAGIAASLDHSNIVPVYAVGEQSGRYYYAMKYIEGHSLARIISAAKRRGPEAEVGTLVSDPDDTALVQARHAAAFLYGKARKEAAPSGSLSTDQPDALAEGRFQRAAEIIAQAAEGLHYAHQRRVIHRDIKPGNLMIDEQGNALITDFGLATDIQSQTLTRSGEIMGTLPYMSREQIDVKSGSLDRRTDIYSLGATLYELLTLRPPFEAETKGKLIQHILEKEPKRPRAHDKRVPLDLDTIAIKTIEKDRDRRYQSAGELAGDLRRYLEGKPISARPVGSITRIVKYIKRHRIAAASSAVAAMLAIILSIFVALTRQWQIREIRDREARHMLEAAMTLKDKHPKAAIGLLQQLGAAYPKSEAGRETWRLIGEIYSGISDMPSAITAFLNAVTAGGEQVRIAQLHLADALIKGGASKMAIEASADALAQCPENEKGSAYLALAKALIASCEFKAAAECLTKARELAGLYPEQTMEMEELAALVKALSFRRDLDLSKYGIVGDVISLAVADVTGDERAEIILGDQAPQLTFLAVEGSQLVKLRTSKLPYQNEELHPSSPIRSLQAADLNGDGKKELIFFAPHGETLKGDVLEYRYEEGGRFGKLVDIDAVIGTHRGICVADVDEDDGLEVILCPSGTGRDPRVYDYNPGYDPQDRLSNPRFFCPELKLTSSDPIAVCAGDVDGDGLSEIILGTDLWRGYDLRVVKLSPVTKEYETIWQRTLGKVGSCLVRDLDKDGVPEIWAAKESSADNRPFFGTEHPRGLPDGVYAYELGNQANSFDQVFFQPMGPDVRSPQCVNIFGAAGKDWLATSCLRGDAAWLYMVYWNDVGQKYGAHSLKIGPAANLPNLASGNVVGDGKENLVWVNGKLLTIFGLSAPQAELGPGPGLERSEGLGEIVLASQKRRARGEQHAHSAAFHKRLAYEFFRANRLRDASQEFEIAWALNRDDCKADDLYKLAECYRGLNQHEEAASVLQRIWENFPQGADKARLKAADILLEAGLWREARKHIRKVNAAKLEDSDLVNESERLTKSVQAMEGLKTVFEEEFSDGIKSVWRINNPFSFRWYRERQCLRLVTVNGQSAPTVPGGGLPVHWDGGSFILSFDVWVESNEWSGDIKFGIAKEDAPRENRHAIAVGFDCGGFVAGRGGGLLNFNAGLCCKQEGNRKLRLRISQQQEYFRSRWYSVKISYNAVMNQVWARVTWWDPASGSVPGVLASMQMVGLQRFPPGNYVIRPLIARTYKGAYTAIVLMDNIKFQATDGTTPITPENDPLYEGRRLFAEGKYADAASEYKKAQDEQSRKWLSFAELKAEEPWSFASNNYLKMEWILAQVSDSGIGLKEIAGKYRELADELADAEDGYGPNIIAADCYENALLLLQKESLEKSQDYGYIRSRLIELYKKLGTRLERVVELEKKVQ